MWTPVDSAVERVARLEESTAGSSPMSPRVVLFERFGAPQRTIPPGLARAACAPH